MPPGRSCPTWPASSSPCTPKGPISPTVPGPWRVAHPLLPGPDHPCPASGVPTTAVFLAETLGKTFTTRAQLASHIRPGTGDQEVRILDQGRARLPRRQQAPQTRHVPVCLRLPQIRPHQPRLLPAQTRPRQTPGPSRPHPGPPPHPDPARHDPKRSPLQPPTSSTATHRRLTHHIEAPPPADQRDAAGSRTTLRG